MLRMRPSSISLMMVVILLSCKTRDFHISKGTQSSQLGLSCNGAPRVAVPVDIMGERRQPELDVYLEMLRRRMCSSYQDSFSINEWKLVLADIAEKIDSLERKNINISESDFPFKQIIGAVAGVRGSDERKLIPINKEAFDSISELRLAELSWKSDSSERGSEMDSSCMRKSVDALRKASGPSSPPLEYFTFWSLAADATNALDGCAVQQIVHSNEKRNFTARLEYLYLRGIFFAPQLWKAFEIRDWFRVTGSVPLLPLGIVSGKKFVDSSVMYSGRFFYHDLTHASGVRSYFPKEVETGMLEESPSDRDGLWARASDFASTSHAQVLKLLQTVDRNSFAESIYMTLFALTHEKGREFSISQINGLAKSWINWSEIFLYSNLLSSRGEALPQDCARFTQMSMEKVLIGPHSEQAKALINSACEAANLLKSGALLESP